MPQTFAIPEKSGSQSSRSNPSRNKYLPGGEPASIRKFTATLAFLLDRCQSGEINEIDIAEKKIKKYVPLSKRQDKPDSALWLIKQHSILKDSQIAKLVGITKNSVTSIRSKNYWNFNNLNPKDPVAMGLFSQKDLIEAIEKAERRIKREKKLKEKVAAQ